MNSIVLFSVLLVTCQVSWAKKDVSSIFLFSAQSDTNCLTPGLQCKDCETIEFCSSNQDSLFQIRCEDQSKTRPFCDAKTNTCVKEQPAVCTVEASTFICPDVGTYPDLENCNNYYICDENKVPENFACSAGFIYNHSVKTCTSGSYCRSYSTKIGFCKGKVNKLIAYAPSKELYVLCLSGKHSMLFECPIKGEIFNEEEVTCKFECTQNGFFSYHLDSTKFYSCVQIGKKFTVNLLDCPEGTEFVELGNGQGICTTKSTTTTTTTTTEATTVLVEEETEGSVIGDEGSGEAPEEIKASPVADEENQEQEDALEDLQNEKKDLNNVLVAAEILYEEVLNSDDDVSNESPAEFESNDDASAEDKRK